jgi:hypothetical protein
MSFQHTWPRGPSMLESIKENALFGNIVALFGNIVAEGT